MAKLSVVAGATSQSVNVFIQNSTVTTGAGLTGLAFNTSSLIAYYTFAGANATATSITLATLAAVNSAYSSGGFKEIDATNMPGVYRLDLPNAVLAASKGRSVVVMLSGASNMAPCTLEIELTAVDNQSTGFGLVNASANMVQIAGASVSASTAQLGVNVVNISGSASTGTAGYVGVDWAQVTNKTTTNALTGTTISSSQVVASVTGAVGSVTGAVGSVTGAVGSVTGSVGSVTGAVGSVTGAVGSITGVTFPTHFSSLSISSGGLVSIDGTTSLTESYAAEGAGLTLSQALYGLTQQLGSMSISGTTMTVLKRDNSTTAKTYTLNSSTAPTSITEAT